MDTVEFIIKRINFFGDCLSHLLVWNAGDHSDKYDIRQIVRGLEKYNGSPEQQCDLEAYKAGELPEGLPADVLFEEKVRNALEVYKANKQAELELFRSKTISPEQGIHDLALALLYLLRFDEPEKMRDGVAHYYTSGISLDTDVLEELEEERFIDYRCRKGQLHLTREGMGEAREILERYGIKDWERNDVRRRDGPKKIIMRNYFELVPMKMADGRIEYVWVRHNAEEG